MPHQCTGCGYTFEDGSKEMLSGCPDCGGNTFQFYPAGRTPEENLSSEEPPKPKSADTPSVAESVGRATTKVRSFVSKDNRAPSGAKNVSGMAGSGVDADTPAEPDVNADDADAAANADINAADVDSDRGQSAAPPDPNAAWPGEEQTGGPQGREDVSRDRIGEDGEIIDADARRESRPTDGEDVAQASARSDIVSPDELEKSAVASNEPAGSSDEETPMTSTEGRVVSEPTGDEPDLSELRAQLNDQFESIKIVEPGQYELNLMELYNREEYIIALQENGRYVIQVPEEWLGENPGDR